MVDMQPFERPRSMGRYPQAVRSLRCIWILLLAVNCSIPTSSLFAQSEDGATLEPESADAEASPAAAISTDLNSSDAMDSEATLRMLLETLRAERAELRDARARLQSAQDAQQRARAMDDIAEIQDDVDELDEKFASLASRVDVSEVENTEDERFDLVKELESLLEPLIHQLKDATEEPRRIDRLRSQVERYEQRLEISNKAIANLTPRIAKIEDAVVKEALEKELKAWKSRRAEFLNRKNVARYELESTLSARKPFFESTGNFVGSFFRNRGLNLMSAVGTFLLVFISMRFIHRRIVAPMQRRRRGSISARIVSVLFHALTFLAAISALIVVLFTVSDWVLLLLVVIFLLGIGWASVQMLPQFLEQIHLMLNVGAVREGERIIFDGLPWRVESLRIYSRLKNEALTGGKLRIPIRDLVGRHSRPEGENEPWFPCREGDWVLLNDDTRGQVVLQTPEVVQLDAPGSALITYPTEQFLDANPRNLSQGFRLSITFGIDYAHQAACTKEIPEIMKQKLAEGLIETVSEEELKCLLVEFKEAGASSLDYMVFAELAGSAAPRYAALKRAMFRILVDASNENGWVIPFTQLTVHQATS